MHISSFVERLDSPALDGLRKDLAKLAPSLEKPAAWPAEQLELCARAGVYRWFIPADSGGFGWNEEEKTRGYLLLARSCLTTTFVITQLMGAIRRVAGSANMALAAEWLESLLAGQRFATVGISHLTTSRQHLDRPALRAEQVRDHYVLDGYCPWVTGGSEADGLVVGATLDDGRELLAMVPTGTPGVKPFPGASLLALSASRTDRVEFKRVVVTEAMIVAGPINDVMSAGQGAGTGGLQTSTLAVGLCGAALDFLREEATRRTDLTVVAESLGQQILGLERELLEFAAGRPGCDPADLRGRANRLVLRVTQAALTASKGAGFVSGHPAGRWCREAMFFLVWSCPQPVSQAHLCELAGLPVD